MHERTAKLWTALWMAWDDLCERWEAVRANPDAGYSTETVLVTALLVVAALVVVAIIVLKVTEKANGITLGMG